MQTEKHRLIELQRLKSMLQAQRRFLSRGRVTRSFSAGRSPKRQNADPSQRQNKIINFAKTLLVHFPRSKAAKWRAQRAGMTLLTEQTRRQTWNLLGVAHLYISSITWRLARRMIAPQHQLTSPVFGESYAASK